MTLIQAILVSAIVFGAILIAHQRGKHDAIQSGSVSWEEIITKKDEIISLNKQLIEAQERELVTLRETIEIYKRRDQQRTR